jgi:hypothetical protein
LANEFKSWELQIPTTSLYRPVRQNEAGSFNRSLPNLSLTDVRLKDSVDQIAYDTPEEMTRYFNYRTVTRPMIERLNSMIDSPYETLQRPILSYFEYDGRPL